MGSVLIVSFVIGWCVLIFVVARRDLKANNIFTKNPYANRGNGPALKKDKPPMKFIYLFALAACFAALGLFSFGSNGDSHFGNYNLYYKSLFFTLAGLINIAINRDDDSFDAHPYLRYAMKLWFSLVFLPSILLTVDYAITNHFHNGEKFLYMCGSAIIYAHGLVMVPLIIITMAIRYISKTTWPLHKKRFRTFVFAEIVMVAALATVQSQGPAKADWSLAWVIYLLVTGVSVYYYHYEELVSFDK